jgi:hypothetical protein
MSIYAVSVCLLTWVGFIAALIIDQEMLGLAWNWVGALPRAAEIAAWIFLLPGMVLLWIWQTTWPVITKVLGFAVLAVWTLMAISSLLKAFRKNLGH